MQDCDRLAPMRCAHPLIREKTVFCRTPRGKHTLEHFVFIGVLVGSQTNANELPRSGDNVLIGQETPVHARLAWSPYTGTLWHCGAAEISRIGFPVRFASAKPPSKCRTKQFDPPLGSIGSRPSGNLAKFQIVHHKILFNGRSYALLSYSLSKGTLKKV